VPPDVADVIRQAFLRRICTRAVGRVVAPRTDEPVSAQAVPRLPHASPRFSLTGNLSLHSEYWQPRRSFFS